MSDHYPIITDEKSTEYDDEDSLFNDQDGQNKQLLASTMKKSINK